jgi:AmmeMemoRadiSam system protein A
MKNHELDIHQRQKLLVLARDAVAAAVAKRRQFTIPNDAWLHVPGASFVTLKIDGELRGCVGSLEPRRALGEDVCSNAISAAFEDPRFPALRASEFPRLQIEISHLSPTEKLDVVSESEALRVIRPGVDGLVVEFGGRRGTLLPQVWEDLADPAEFLGHVKRKAGLPGNFWDDRIELHRYTVAHWSESNPSEGFEEHAAS